MAATSRLRSLTPLRTFLVAAGIAGALASPAAGGALASTDPNVDLTLIQYTPECQQAARQYRYHLDRVMDFMDAGINGPRLDREIDLMWQYYDIVVNDCGIDVYDWGDDHG